MIVAYLILAHADPEQLRRLVATLPDDSPVFIHVDKRAPSPTYDAMRAALAGRMGKTVFVRRHLCRWGSIGIVRGTMEMIRQAAGVEFDYATLLSGADYPIKSNEQIAMRLSVASGAQFIEAKSSDNEEANDRQDGLYQASMKMRRYHIRFRSRVFPTGWIRKVPNALIPHGGSQWWTLTHAAVTYIADYDRRHPRLMRFATHSFIPDESVIQTIIGNSPFAKDMAQDNLRCVIWDRPVPPYPATLVSEDFDLLAASPDLFARKFNPGMDSAILDRIDTALRR